MGVVKGKGAKYIVMEDDLSLDGGHTVRYTDHVSQKCTLETYMTLGTNDTPINLIKNKVLYFNVIC